MKKLYFLCMGILLMTAFSACGDRSKPESDDEGGQTSAGYSLHVRPRSIELLVDSTQQLEVTIEPQLPEGTTVEITFHSDDEDVATVSRRGLVTAVGEGSATIQVSTVVAGEKLERTCDVTVNKNGLIISPRSLNLFVGDTARLSAEMRSGETVAAQWKSLDATIASVSSAGKVEAKKAGETRIVAISKSDSKMTDTIDVQVTEVVKLTPNQLEITGIGATAELSCNIASAEWLVRDESIASISGEGNKRTIKGMKEGTTFVVVSYGEKQDSASVRVGNPALEVTPAGDLNMIPGAKKTLTCNYAKADWTLKAGGNTVVKLTNKGNGVYEVEALAEGSTDLTVSYLDKKVTIHIVVKMDELLILPEENLRIAHGDKRTLSSNYTNVTWSIQSGSDVISLKKLSNGSCEIEGLAVGTATVKATASGKTATKTVEVYLGGEIEITPAGDLRLEYGDTLKLKCNYNATWSVKSGSSYISIVSQSNGECRIAGKGLGMAKVQASFAGQTVEREIEVYLDPLVITPSSAQRLEATKTLQLSCNNPKATWSVESGTSYATVDAKTGKVTAKAAVGTAVIAAKLGPLKQTVSVEVWMQNLTVSDQKTLTWYSISGEYETNYYKLYGIDVDVESSASLNNHNYTSGGCVWMGTGKGQAEVESGHGFPLATRGGIFRYSFLKVSHRTTSGTFTFKYGSQSVSKTLTVTLPALTANPSSLTMNPGDEKTVKTNYSENFNSLTLDNSSHTLTGASPAGFVKDATTTTDDLHGVIARLKAVSPGQATLNIVHCGENVSVPVKVEPKQFRTSHLNYSNVYDFTQVYTNTETPASFLVLGVQASWMTATLADASVATVSVTTQTTSTTGGSSKVTITPKKAGKTTLTLRSGSQTITMTVHILGALKVGSSYFSLAPSNLRYNGSSYSLSSNAYTVAGVGSTSGTFDLFGWDFGSHPTKSTTSNSDYSTSGDMTFKRKIDGIEYTLPDRYDLAALFTDNYYAFATVNGVKGVIFYPKTKCTLPIALTTGGSSYSANTITSTSWSSLQDAGAIFLPAAGRRDGTSYESGDGYYWSKTRYGSSDGYALRLSTKAVSDWYFRRGFTVRLKYDGLPQFK